MMSDDLLDEIVHELRKQNVLIEKLNRKQKESTWYLWLISLILLVSVFVPFVLAAIEL